MEISAVKFCSYFTHFLCAQPIMPHVSKRRQRSQSGNATIKHKKHRANMWRQELEFFSDLKEELKNPNGCSRTLEENKFLLLALLRELRQRVQSMNEGHLHPSKITWTSIEKAVASDFCAWPKHVAELRCNFFDDGEVIIFGQENERGTAANNYDKSKQQKLTTELLLEMIKFVDKQHAEGHSVTNAKIRAWLQEVHSMEVHHRTMQRGLLQLGLMVQSQMSKENSRLF